MTIRRDADHDGVQETDELVGGAAVTIRLTGTNGTTYGIFNGTTNTSGVFRTAFATNLVDQTYVAEVTGLSHASYIWNHSLDPTANDADMDEDNLPDEQHAIPHWATSAAHGNR